MFIILWVVLGLVNKIGIFLVLGFFSIFGNFWFDSLIEEVFFFRVRKYESIDILV